MRKAKTFTDRVIRNITIFIVIAILLSSLLAAKQTWDLQLSVKKSELATISTIVLNKVANHFNLISSVKQDNELSNRQKVEKLNSLLQHDIDHIAKEYPHNAIGYYDLDLDSVIVCAPNFDAALLRDIYRSHPYFRSFESGKPEFVYHDTSKIWSGKPIFGITLPVFADERIIGTIWVNIKTEDLINQSMLLAGKIILVGLLIWLIVIYILRRSVRYSLHVLNDFSQDIMREKFDERIYSKVPELAPVLVKIKSYTDDLRYLNAQSDLSKSFLKTIIEGISDGLYAMDNDWRFTYLNKGARQGLFKSESLIGKNIWEEYPQEIGTETYANLHQAKADKTATYWQAGSGLTDKYHSYSAYPYHNGITVLSRDSTEEKQTEAKLMQLAAIVEQSNYAIISMTVEGIIKTWNNASERMFGYKSDEVIGKHIAIIVPEGFLYEKDMFDKVLSGINVDNFETLRQKKDGSLLNVSFTISPIIDENGKVCGVSKIVRDITQRIGIEKELKEEIMERKRGEADLKVIFDNKMLGIATGTLDGKLLKANQVFQDIVGYTEEELLTLDRQDYCHPEDYEKQVELDQALSSGKCDHYEIKKRYIRKDGTIKWVSFMMVITSRDVNKRFIAFVQDITEKKLIEEQMIKLDRLNLIGEMAAGISHEVRNPMSTVRGFLQILKNKAECAKYADQFELMLEELDRANSIITEFLSIGRNNPVDLAEENINNIIENIKPLIEADAYTQDKYLEVETSEVPNLLLNQKEMRQLILNLSRNGFEAMAAGGTLKIMTFTEEDKIVLAVQDQGTGIKPEVLEKIGTPFFTTKPDGTGLGLGICYGIASRHNANISIETDSSGTTFFVNFKKIEHN